MCGGCEVKSDDVRYEVHYGDKTEVFTSPYITQLWSWLGNVMEPGDTLHWLSGGDD
ncbi:hypothetical protein PBI_TWEETY_42 [Mycobacterium phage Tweety]|uniref:DUF7372 domain-containing protein n=1 Tax=Mycobacterium phage Tweety TaxID=439809 RepID=A5YK10_9CAUD|nr:hypothetical protein PBI_TWEETY_42 [Mycobacterium phage Tweety]ABQ86111.1 hypothetical protein PBI_TWEETY_42 [Mycobacterium phage Tweety]